MHSERCTSGSASRNAKLPVARSARRACSAQPYDSTWQCNVYVAFVIDVFARYIVVWRVRASMQTDFLLNAREQAPYVPRAERDGTLVYHGDRGSQYGRSATASGWSRPALGPWGVAPAIATTTRWPRPSTGCSRPRSSPGAGPERRARRSNWLPTTVGVVVQLPTPAGEHRLHPAGRSTGQLPTPRSRGLRPPSPTSCRRCSQEGITELRGPWRPPRTSHPPTRRDLWTALRVGGLPTAPRCSPPA